MSKKLIPFCFVTVKGTGESLNKPTYFKICLHLKKIIRYKIDQKFFYI